MQKYNFFEVVMNSSAEMLFQKLYVYPIIPLPNRQYPPNQTAKKISDRIVCRIASERRHARRAGHTSSMYCHRDRIFFIIFLAAFFDFAAVLLPS